MGSGIFLMKNLLFYFIFFLQGGYKSKLIDKNCKRKDIVKERETEWMGRHWPAEGQWEWQEEILGQLADRQGHQLPFFSNRNILIGTLSEGLRNLFQAAKTKGCLASLFSCNQLRTAQGGNSSYIAFTSAQLPNWRYFLSYSTLKELLNTCSQYVLITKFEIIASKNEIKSLKASVQA